MSVSTAPLPSTIDYYFDPGCPWTWATSRWLVEAAGLHGVDIRWRILSLAVLNEGKDVPEQYRPVMAAGRGAHRVMAALLADGEEAKVGELYTEIGRHVHHDGEMPSVELFRKLVADVGAGAWADAIDDPKWDAVLEESTAYAVELAGPDVGSPVMVFDEPNVGIFGPILSPAPTGEDAARLLDVVVAAARIPGFYELKRGRRTGPQQGPRP